eukprot:GEMP01065104.1.p1 GENE.GEMP01065104.1~~GEMP01065104.1.p1  ORF type:complete len:109 (+),score=14.71 GEMP01065104.1:137-463(+)
METVDSSQRQELTPLTASAQAPPRIRIHSASILPRPEYGFFDNAYQKAMRTLGLLAKIFCAPCLDVLQTTLRIANELSLFHGDAQKDSYGERNGSVTVIYYSAKAKTK